MNISFFTTISLQERSSAPHSPTHTDDTGRIQCHNPRRIHRCLWTASSGIRGLNNATFPKNDEKTETRSNHIRFPSDHIRFDFRRLLRIRSLSRHDGRGGYKKCCGKRGVDTEWWHYHQWTLPSPSGRYPGHRDGRRKHREHRIAEPDRKSVIHQQHFPDRDTDDYRNRHTTSPNSSVDHRNRIRDKNRSEKESTGPLLVRPVYRNREHW